MHVVIELKVTKNCKWKMMMNYICVETTPVDVSRKVSERGGKKPNTYKETFYEGILLFSAFFFPPHWMKSRQGSCNYINAKGKRWRVELSSTILVTSIVWRRLKSASPLPLTRNMQRLKMNFNDCLLRTVALPETMFKLSPFLRKLLIHRRIFK